MSTHRTVTRVLQVCGLLWNGQKCLHEYTLKPDQIVKSMADAKRVAVDFEHLTWSRVVITDTLTVTVDKTTIIASEPVAP